MKPSIYSFFPEKTTYNFTRDIMNFWPRRLNGRQLTEKYMRFFWALWIG